MTAVGDVDAVVSAVSWVAVALSPLALAGLVANGVAQHRRPAPDPNSTTDQLSSRSADTPSADPRPTDRR